LFLNQFWESCKDNVIKASLTLEKIYNNPRNYLEEIFRIKNLNSNPKVKLVYSNKNDSTAYIGESIPCENKCSCAYCSKSCKNNIIPDYQCLIFGLNCFVFEIIFGCFVLIILILSFILVIIQRLFLIRRSNQINKFATNDEKLKLLQN
jgi:hypothetical protein